MVFRQSCRRLHPLVMHELISRLIAASHLERRKQSSLLRNGLLCHHIIWQVGVVILVCLRWHWLLRQRRWRWGQWWWRAAFAAREHGVGREAAARHFFCTGGV
jgi:hypothetical protein